MEGDRGASTGTNYDFLIFNVAMVHAFPDHRFSHGNSDTCFGNFAYALSPI